MLEIKKIPNYRDERFSDFKITQGDKELNIVFGGTGDWCFYVNKINFIDEEQVVNFEITDENYELYSLFDILYNKIINCKLYKINEYDLERCTKEELEEKQIQYDEWNRELRENPPYNLIHDGIISWRHDDQIFEEANILNIYKEENKYRLEFILTSKELSHIIDVRFRTSGSRYQKFYMPFIDLYRSLQFYGTPNMEEYLCGKQYIKNNNKK